MEQRLLLSNATPTANAGPDQNVALNSLVTLNGTGSSDPEGQALTYAWTQTAGATVTLNDPTAANPTFTALTLLAGQTLTFGVVVSDGINSSSADTVNIVVAPEDNFQIEVTTTTSLQDFKVRFVNPGSLHVDWGDGNATDFNATINATHTYASAGVYTIRMNGYVNLIDFFIYPDPGLGTPKLISAIKTPIRGITGLNSAYEMFKHCENIPSIPPGLFDLCPGITTFYDTFLACKKITSIPPGLFDAQTNVTNFYATFDNCDALTSIPAGLFDKHVNNTNFAWTFAKCYSLQSIPAGLFDKHTKVTTFSYAFFRCYALTSIPSHLFDNNTRVTTFSYAFDECNNLTAIPSQLFDKNTLVTTYANAFYGCTKLTGASPTNSTGQKLWELSPTPTGTNCFTNCTGLTDYQSIPAAWGGPNSAPTDIALSASSVLENQPIGTTVATLSTTDPNAGNTFTYSLVAGTGSADNASFTISGGSLQSAGSFDYETKSAYSIRVRTTDQGGLYFEKQFTISVTDVNEDPVITSNGGGTTATLSIAENATAITTVTSTDPDAGAIKTYSISGGADAASFAIDSGTGVLTLISAPNFEAPTDSGSNNVYDVTVQVSDGSLTDTQAIAVTVTNANEMPTALTLSNCSVSENQTAGAIVGTLGTDDPDAGNTFTYTLVAGGADNALFQTVGSQLQTAAIFDFDLITSYSILIRTSDQDGLTLDANFTIRVTFAGITLGPGGAYDLVADGGSAFTIHVTAGTINVASDLSAGGRFVNLDLAPNTAAVLASSQHLAAMTLGDHASLQMPASAAHHVLCITALAFNPTATLDLTTNDLVLDYGSNLSPLGAIEALVRSGYNAGSWTGTGITSSAAAADAGSYSLGILDNAQRPTPFTTFDGITVPTTVVIAKFTWVADLDLDGLVTSNDAIIFANNYSEGQPATHRLGDLNYNGLFDSNDAILFANTYNESLPLLPSVAAADLVGFVTPIETASTQQAVTNSTITAVGAVPASVVTTPSWGPSTVNPPPKTVSSSRIAAERNKHHIRAVSAAMICAETPPTLRQCKAHRHNV